jgi:hypothetical protein
MQTVSALPISAHARWPEPAQSIGKGEKEASVVPGMALERSFAVPAICMLFLMA